jgi:hypothetical protein
MDSFQATILRTLVVYGGHHLKYLLLILKREENNGCITI